MWFVVSVAVCLAVAFVYIKRQQPVYERGEEILIKDQESGGSMADLGGMFATMGLFASNTNVNNELISLKSPAVMQEVARRLHLDINYDRRGGFHPVTLYGRNLPVEVVMSDVDEQGSASFRMALRPDGSARLWKFTTRDSEGEKVKFPDEVTLSKGDSVVKTPLGMVRITPNPDYSGLPLTKETEIDVEKEPLQNVVEHYCDILNGDLVDREADVIGLSIRDVNVQRAVDILNTILKVYDELWVADKNKISEVTSDFISDRLAVIQQELGEVDSSIARYMKEAGTPDFMASSKAAFEKSGALDKELLMLSNYLSMTEFMKDFIEKNSDDFKIIPGNTFGMMPNATGSTSLSVTTQIDDYNQTLLARNNLMSGSSASNPLVREYDANLSVMRDGIITGLDNQIKNLKAQISGMRRELSATEGKIAGTSTKALPLLSEERQQTVKESLYLFLLQKREENELSRKFMADNLRVITPPMGSLKPVSPRKGLILAGSLLLGVLVPLVVIYIQVAGDTKVRSRRDLDGVGIPFAGEIPQVGKKRGMPLFHRGKNSRKDETPLVVVEEGKRDVVNEAFRVVRGNLDFMSDRNAGCDVVMLTSFNPGSGKSFISYNLGLSFALKQKRVLLIDCDLRRKSSSLYAGNPSKGLTNYLTGSVADWHELLKPVPSGVPMNVLPVGKTPPNPTELLENGRIEEIISQAEKEYDIVILDCPPVDIVADTRIIGRSATQTLFTVRAGLLEKSALNELNEFYAEKRFNNMSLLLNGTEALHSRYYTYGNYADNND